VAEKAYHEQLSLPRNLIALVAEKAYHEQRCSHCQHVLRGPRGSSNAALVLASTAQAGPGIGPPDTDGRV
jgi:transposase